MSWPKFKGILGYIARIFLIKPKDKKAFPQATVTIQIKKTRNEIEGINTSLININKNNYKNIAKIDNLGKMMKLLR